MVILTITEATKSDSDVYIFKGEDFETDEEPQVMMLVSIVLIKHHQLTCQLLNVSPPHQLKKTIGEKVLPFTYSLKLEIIIVK